MCTSVTEDLNGGGVWLVRWRVGTGYRQKLIATADDVTKEGTLDFNATVRSTQ
jgi:hypothetical protein